MTTDVPSHVLRVTDITRPFEFDLSRPLEIEVGCGKGQFLTRRAAANPDCEFLGIERMLERVRLFAFNGVFSTATTIDDAVFTANHKFVISAAADYN